MKPMKEGQRKAKVAIYAQWQWPEQIKRKNVIALKWSTETASGEMEITVQLRNLKHV